MRVGLYMGRHTADGGMAVYARGILRGLVTRIGKHDQIVVYGDRTVLSNEFLHEILNSEVLATLGRALFDRPAGHHLLTLPNSAQIRCLIRVLPLSKFPRVGMLIDQILLPFLVLFDRLSLIHGAANTTVLIPIKPRMVTIHDLFQAYPPVAPRGLRKRLIALLYRLFFYLQFRAVDNVLVDAAETADEIRQRYGRGDSRVVPLGVDQSFERLAQEIEADRRIVLEWRTKRKLPEGYLLLLASADPRKNLNGQLNAIKRLSQQEKSKGIVIVLSDPRARSLVVEAMQGELSSSFLYILERPEYFEIPLLYSAANVFLNATLREGFGLPTLESLRLGCRVVTGPLSFLQKDDSAVFLCQPESEDSILDAVKEALKPQNRGRLSGNYRRNLTDTAEETLGWYRRITAERHNARR